MGNGLSEFDWDAFWEGFFLEGNFIGFVTLLATVIGSTYVFLRLLDWLLY